MSLHDDLPHAAPPRWDLFCRVVDNFGDAGIAWRLAQGLVHEHGIAVTLWIDAPAALARLVPELDPQRDRQDVGGIRVRTWRARWEASVDADVVVEMFGAGLPDAYVDAMATRTPRPRWFVLEYLSAEPWVDAHHGLPSPHPRVAIARRFWFPGFTARTGGLLRERDLLERRDAFRRDTTAPSTFLRELGVHADANGLVASLFCYPFAPVAALLDAWSHGAQPIVALVPEGIAHEPVTAWCNRHARRDGNVLAAGALALVRIPFVPQTRYDELLWSCDFNLVRGEDSFVRAQWAARPFAWHIYPQQDAAHVPKLDAFLRRYLEQCPPAAAAALHGFWHAWNALPDAVPMTAAWPSVERHLRALRAHAERWAQALGALPELTATLVRAASDRV